MSDPIVPIELSSPTSIFGDHPDPNGAAPVTPPVTPAPAAVPAAAEPAEAPVTPPAVPASSLSPEDVARIAAAAAQAVQPAAPAGPPEPELTDDQLREKLGFKNLSEEDLSKLYAGGPEAVKVLQDALLGSAQYAKLSTVYYVQELLKELRQEFSPVLQQSMVAEATKHKEAFFTKHKDLANDKYMPVLSQVHKSLQASNALAGKTSDQIYDLVATESRKILSSLGITPAAAAASAQPNTTPSGVSSSNMTPLPSGGGTGGAPAAGAAAGDPQRATRMAIFS